MKKIFPLLIILTACAALAGCTPKPSDVAPPYVVGETAFTVPYGFDGTAAGLLRAADDVDGQLTLSDEMLAGECDFFAVGVYPLVLTLTDSAGNSADYDITITVKSDLDELSDEGAFSPAAFWRQVGGYWAGIEYKTYVYFLRFWDAPDGRRVTYGRFCKNGATEDARVIDVVMSGEYAYLTLAPVTGVEGGFAVTDDPLTMRIMYGIRGDKKLRSNYARQDGFGNPEFNYVGDEWQDMLDRYSAVYPLD